MGKRKDGRKVNRWTSLMIRLDPSDTLALRAAAADMMMTPTLLARAIVLYRLQGLRGPYVLCFPLPEGDRPEELMEAPAVPNGEEKLGPWTQHMVRLEPDHAVALHIASQGVQMTPHGYGRAAIQAYLLSYKGRFIMNAAQTSEAQAHDQESDGPV